MPTMMLLIGMKINLTKKPMNPMIAKPSEVARAILVNSARGERRARAGYRMSDQTACARAERTADDLTASVQARYHASTHVLPQRTRSTGRTARRGAYRCGRASCTA